MKSEKTDAKKDGKDGEGKAKERCTAAHDAAKGPRTDRTELYTVATNAESQGTEHTARTQSATIALDAEQACQRPR